MKKNYSYVTYLGSDNYIFGVILLYKSLKDVKSEYPLEVLVASNVTKPILNILGQMGLHYQIVENIECERMVQFNQEINLYLARSWALGLSKLKIFTLEQYDKIVYLDCDIYVLKNLDHLFEYPHLSSAVDGEYFNLWKDKGFINAGCMVIKPSQQEYDNLIKYMNEADYSTWYLPNKTVSDQDLLNTYYDLINKPELHLNKYYNIFAMYIQEEQLDDILDNAYFIHFTGRKPWRAFNKSKNETYSEFLYEKAHTDIQAEVDKLDWNKAKKTIKLAVYGICKDEKANIEKFVKCFSKADYLCILDTGSTDGTWEYLQKAKKKYPNLIIEQQIFDPWRYDTARNKSLELVPKDTTMYFMMDLDEIIKEDGWVEKIKNTWDPLFARGAYVYNRRVDPVSDSVIQKFIEYRIHSNLWHYQGIVHEQLHDVGGRREFFADECIQVPITVWHYPTNPNREIYIELCERGVEEQPNNWIMHLQLAAEYEVHEKWDKAITEYRKILAEQVKLSPPEVGRCYASLGRILGITGKKEEALRVLEKGRAVIPNYGDNYFLAGEICYNTQKYKECFELCKEGLANSDSNQWCTIVSREGYYPYFLMGLSQYYLGNKVEGLGYITIAREKNNNEETNKIYIGLINEITNGR